MMIRHLSEEDQGVLCSQHWALLSPVPLSFSALTFCLSSEQVVK